MIWDIDSYIIFGEEAKPIKMTGVDLIPAASALERLNDKYRRKQEYDREYRKRRRGTKD